MKCDSELLEDYVEGFLETSELQKIEAHLVCCESCQNEYKQLVNEQKALVAQLNTTMMTHSQSHVIMKHIHSNAQRKKSWRTLNISIISAAVIMLSFAFYYWNHTPNEVAQPIDGPTQLVETNGNEQEEFLTSEQVPRYDEPFLDVSINEVMENGDNTDISYRVKFNDKYQRYNDNLYDQVRMRYPYEERADQAQIDHTQDEFFGKVRTNAHIAIRNEAGELIAGHVEGEQPMLENWGVSGKGTDVLGEMIYTISVPSYTKPATLEVLAMEAEVLDLYETKVTSAHLQPFQFENATYSIDALEIKQGTLNIQISTEGEPKIRIKGWEIVTNNRLTIPDRGSIDFINNRTIYTLQFNDYEQIPSSFKLVPFTVMIKKQIEPLLLELD